MPTKFICQICFVLECLNSIFSFIFVLSFGDATNLFLSLQRCELRWKTLWRAVGHTDSPWLTAQASEQLWVGGEDVIQPLQCLSMDAVKLSSVCLCELCSGSFGEGESNFARSHLLNLSNGDYAEQI